MRLILSYAIEFAAAAVILIPIMTVLGIAYLRDIRTSVWYTAFALYLSAVCIVVGAPSVTSLTFDPTVEAIPFVSMIEDAKNCALNVLLFVPLGAFLPLLWKRFGNLRRTVLFGFVTSLTIETLQLFTFRTTDVDDLITNTAGTVVGYFIIKFISDKKRLAEPNGKTCDLYILCGIVAAVMFFAQSALSGVFWDMVY